jgi:glycerol-3-phosphate acyltransferase PlsY
MVPEILVIMIALTYSYCLGSVPTAYLVGRWVRGIDLRQYGSGNIGGSNLAAHVGKAYFIPVFGFDLFMKGVTTVLIARTLDFGEILQGLIGITAVIGHSWPFYTRFIGGRGVSTATGVLLILAPLESLVCSGFASIMTILFKKSALWVGISMILVPTLGLLSGMSREVIYISIVLIITLTLKRLEANHAKRPPGVSWKHLFIRRFIFDRDVSATEEWTKRTPKLQDD